MDKETLRNIKIIIADIDGTVTSVGGYEVSDRLKTAVQSAVAAGLHFTLASGRGFTEAERIFNQLELTTMAVISAGTEVVDPKTGQVAWGQKLSLKQLESIMQLLKPYDPKVLFAEEPADKIAELSKRDPVSDEQQTVFVIGLDSGEAEEMVRDGKALKEIGVHTTPSWTEGKVDVHFTHEQANKQHTVTELLAMYGIDMQHAAGVGDSGNDLPLFRAVGFKVAMGNGSDELKAAADTVVGTVEEDGLAQFIEAVVAAHSE